MIRYSGTKSSTPGIICDSIMARFETFTSFILKYLLSAYPANMATIIDSTHATTDTSRLFLI